jgi:hypothetical protein
MSVLVIAQYAAALMTIGAFIGMLVKWAVVKPIKLYIDQMTYPIQPNANGGKSLPDLVAKVENLQDSLNLHLLRHEIRDDTPK